MTMDKLGHNRDADQQDLVRPHYDRGTLLKFLRASAPYIVGS